MVFMVLQMIHWRRFESLGKFGSFFAAPGSESEALLSKRLQFVLIRNKALVSESMKAIKDFTVGFKHVSGMS